MVAVFVAALAVVAAAWGGAGAPAATESAAAPGSSERALIACGQQVTIGYLGPTTGPVASIGAELKNWGNLAVQQWNANARNRVKIRVIEGDTQFDPAQVSTLAQQFASNNDMLGVLGPGASQEVLAAAPAFKRAGFAYIAASATRTSLTNGSNPGFFRIAPPDSQQAASSAAYMTRDLKVKRVYVVDDQTAYSVPLAEEVQRILRRAKVPVDRDSITQQQSDFSSVISKIPDDTDIVYLPIQLPAKMQLFGQQMREQGKRARLFVGDAGFTPDFTIDGSYFSTFAPDIRNIPKTRGLVRQYFRRFGAKAPLTTFGPPSYISGQVLTAAIGRACANGTATRAEVKREVQRTSLPDSIINAPIRFDRRGDRIGARFVIFQIRNGKAVFIK